MPHFLKKHINEAIEGKAAICPGGINEILISKISKIINLLTSLPSIISLLS